MSRSRSGRGGSNLTGLTCLLGRHQHGEDHSVGAGIQRRVCEKCGAVTIDLTQAEGLDGRTAKTRQVIISPGSGL